MTPDDLYTTSRKVFAEGARASEVPLPRPTSLLFEKPGTNVKVPLLRRPRRKMFRRLNHCSVPGYAPICADTNDPDTQVCGMKKRLLRDLPKARPDFYLELRRFVRQWCRKHLPHASVLGFEEWLESTSYNEARKNELRKAHDDLRGGVPTKRQLSHVDSFGKTESYDEYKFLRWINSRPDVDKTFSGPRHKAVEQVINGLPADLPVRFSKKMLKSELAHAIRNMKKPGRFYKASDFTAFESHFIPELIDACEGELYRWVLADDEHIELLISMLTGKNKMRTRLGVRATVEGRRMSGDTCTSLGNGFTNMMMALFIASRKQINIGGFVEGDDGLFWTDGDITNQDYADCGFTIKMQDVEDPCEASYCGLIFSNTGEIVRNPRSVFSTFGWTTSFTTAGPRIMDELLRAKALSSIFETPQCPIVGVLARKALKETEGVVPRFVFDGYHVDRIPNDTKHVPDFAPSSDVRLLFNRIYGISVDDQLRCEAFIRAGRFEELQYVIPPNHHMSDYVSKFLVVT